MPIVTEDPVLQRRLAKFVSSNGGIRPAARQLELEHTMIYRLLKGGRVIERNRVAASAALDRLESATPTKSATKSATAPNHQGALVSSSELIALRNFCTSVVALIDYYNSTGGELAALSADEASSA